mgnify:CR=1 FL=1
MINEYKIADENISFLEESSKNKYGQYFTPTMVAEFMIDLAEINEKSKILEPSCGEGVFLDLLKNKYADFKGRARRSEFWYFLLFFIIINIILSVIDLSMKDP